MAVATHDIGKQGEWSAEFRGIAGWAHEDRQGRLVFVPDGASLESQAYRQTVADVGGEWDEWTFEVEVVVQRNNNGVVLVENP